MTQAEREPKTWPDIAHMSREDLEGEVAALRHALNEQRDELTKVRGYQAELAERCYRKDLELDELREHRGHDLCADVYTATELAIGDLNSDPR